MATKKQTIYKLWLSRPKDPFYELTPKEREKLWDNITKKLNQFGAKRCITCDSSWSSEQWPFYGIEQFPDIEAIQKYEDAIRYDLNLFKYIESMSFLGTESPQFPIENCKD